MAQRLVPLLSTFDIAEHIADLGKRIARDYAGRKLMLLAVLKGAAPFATDLMRAIPIEHTIEFVRVRSYQGTESTGHVEFVYLPERSIAGHDVLILDDILDTGRTLHALREKLQTLGAASVAICTLLDKPARRVIPIEADYAGFTIADLFVVGYGLDHEDRYRHLDAIYYLEDT